MTKNDASRIWPKPWPIDAIIASLKDGDNLYRVVRPRQAVRGFDVRENILEQLIQDVMIEQFGSDRVALRKRIGSVLKLGERPFPARTMPDVTVVHGGQVHILEVKSSRTDYRRFDNVFDSRPFREYLAAVGDAGRIPWEVEQDLIKLHLYKDLSARTGSCLFLMVDAFEGPGRSWTDVFSSGSSFADTMQTKLVRGWANTILAATRIEPVVTRNASARLITCLVRN